MGYMPLRLILASKSPRRADLLRLAGVPFAVRAVDVPEVPQPGEAPEAYVSRLAASKAAASGAEEGEVVLAADTIVVVDGAILEKPANVADAERMLGLLSGRTHRVMTGICLVGRPTRSDQTQSEDATETTHVRFVQMTETEIATYAASGEPMDKAGGYAIQGLAAKFIDRIEGCYFNVVGLPLALVYKMLAGRV